MVIVPILLVFLLAGFASAEQAKPTGPALLRKARTTPHARQVPPSARFSLPRPVGVSLPLLESKDLANLTPVPGGKSLGIHRSLQATAVRLATDQNGQVMQMDGAWNDTPDGNRVWRMMVGSEGAAGVRIHFSDFDAGAGIVWVHGEDTEEQAEFSGRGPWDNGDFWTPIIFSDTLYVEYEPDPAEASSEPAPFQIREISHLWRAPELGTRPGVMPPPSLPDNSENERRTLSSIPAPLFLKHFEGLLPFTDLRISPSENALTPAAAAPCQLDASCYPEWEETARSVALIVFESAGATYSCSGTLLNTRENSFTPYFLTAAHCVESDSVARTVESFWFFDSSSCNGPVPGTSSIPSVLGARQVKRFGNFNDPRGDFNLLLLEDVPDGAVFSGWDPDPVPFTTQLVGLHHPEGEYKRIMFGEAVPDDYYGMSDAYLIVKESQGRTEEGSSGSGIFSSQNVLVGALSFGPAIPMGSTVCDINPSYVGYSRFSELYPEISDYLEDITPPPEDSNQQLESGEPRDFSLSAVQHGTFFTDPIFNIDVPSGATKLTVDLEVSTASADVDLYVRYGRAPELQHGQVIADFSSYTPYGTEQVVVDDQNNPSLQAGTYYIAFVVWTRWVDIEAQITATVEPDSASAEGPPQLGAVVNGAAQTIGAVAPGEIVTLYGVNIGPASGFEVSLNADGILPVEAQGTQVYFNGIPVPLFFVRYNQVNAQVPYEVSGLTSVQVQVVFDGSSSETLSLDVATSAPGIFMFLDGSNSAVVLNQDGALNSASNPESRGRIVTFFATGEGVMSPRRTTGEPAPMEPPFPVPDLPVAVHVGGVDAEILYAGAAPGYVGLLQVNARIPVGAITGSNVPIELQVGENTSTNTVTMAVE